MRRVVRVLPMCAIVAAALAAGRCDAAAPAKAAAKPISMEFTNHEDNVFTVLVEIAAEADIGILMVGERGREVPVFAILKEVPADEAIALIAHEAGFVVEPIGGTLVVKAAPPAPRYGGYASGYSGYGGYSGYAYGSPSAGSPYDLTSQEDWRWPAPLVDLNMQGATIADAVAALNRQVKDWLWEIVVDGAVSEDTKINAKVFKLPLRQVLRMVLSQTGLTMTVESVPGDEERMDVRRVIHVVPQPSVELIRPAGIFAPPPPPAPPLPSG